MRRMRKALLLALALVCPAASQSAVPRADGAIDSGSLDQHALVPAPDPLLERAPTPASVGEVAAAVNDVFLKDLMQLRVVMLHVLDKGPQLGLGVVHKWIRDNTGLDRRGDEAQGCSLQHCRRRRRSVICYPYLWHVGETLRRSEAQAATARATPTGTGHCRRRPQATVLPSAVPADAGCRVVTRDG